MIGEQMGRGEAGLASSLTVTNFGLEMVIVADALPLFAGNGTGRWYSIEKLVRALHEQFGELCRQEACYLWEKKLEPHAPDGTINGVDPTMRAASFVAQPRDCPLAPARRGGRAGSQRAV